MRVCQTIVRRPRCTGIASPVTRVPSGAAGMKLVLLSIVVVPAPSGRLRIVPVAPSVSAKAMIAPPCNTAGRVHSSSRTGNSATTRSGAAWVNSMPINAAKGSISDLIFASASMPHLTFAEPAMTRVLAGPQRRRPAQSGTAPRQVDIAAGPAYLPPGQPMGARGGIGRRARFRSVFRKEWWFDSTRAHHSPAALTGSSQPHSDGGLGSLSRLQDAVETGRHFSDLGPQLFGLHEVAAGQGFGLQPAQF